MHMHVCIYMHAYTYAHTYCTLIDGLCCLGSLTSLQQCLYHSAFTTVSLPHCTLIDGLCCPGSLTVVKIVVMMGCVVQVL